MQALGGRLAAAAGEQARDLFGRAEVGQLHVALAVHQNVAALDVAVHDVVAVQVLQALRKLACFSILLEDVLFER